MTKIWLVSAAGGNLGDDLIAIHWINFYRKAFPGITVVVDCCDPNKFKYILEKNQIRYSVILVDIFWSSVRRYNGDWWLSLCQLRSDIMDDNNIEIRHAKDWINSSIAIHFLGGGYINELWTNNALLIALAAGFKKALGIPILWTGCSVYPIDPVILMDLAEDLSGFDLIRTRDEESWQALSLWNQNTELGIDDLFPMALGFKFATSDESYLFINCQSDVRSVQEFQKQVTMLSTYIKSSNLIPIYLSGCDVHDTRCFQILKCNHPNIQFKLSHEFISEIIDSRFCIGRDSRAIVSRFHIHMILSAVGVKGSYIVGDSNYYKNKHQLLVKQGSGFDLFEKSNNLPTNNQSYEKNSIILKKNAEEEKIMGLLSNRVC